MKTDSRVVLAISVIAVIFVLSLMLCLTNPADSSTSGLAAIVVLGVSALLFFIFRLILRMIYRKRPKLSSASDSGELGDWSGFFSRKSTVLLVAFLAGKFALNTLAQGPKSVSAIAIIFSHVLLLVILGILYSRWAGSLEYVPIVATIIVVLADSFYHVFHYASNPSYQFRYGPEIVWFAAVGFTARFTALPLFTVIIWGSWRFSAVNRLRQKDTDKGLLVTLD
jgi:hypothetical protein